MNNHVDYQHGAVHLKRFTVRNSEPKDKTVNKHEHSLF